MLHQIREQAEGATPTFLLQRMSPLLPDSKHPHVRDPVAIRGVSELVVLTYEFSQFDPFPTFSVRR